MQILYFVGITLLAYVIGAIPMGLLVVKLATGKDIRTFHSGRTGGTNAMRAAGFWAGLLTALLDIFKGASGVWLARFLLPGNHWLEVLAPIAVVIGHNYSIFLADRDENGKFQLKGGAGGAPTVGGVVGLWWPGFFILVPIGAVLLFGLGYASVATMSIPVMALIIFIIRGAMGLSPWHYVLYPILVEILLVWALRPNIKRLMNGTERLVGWRAKRQANLQSESIPNNS
jgi:acyl phosphate:glycerol-3-phosphate acyltransferase